MIIGAEGYVKGFLRAKDLVVFGRFEGNIIVSGLTVLHQNASVFGNLYTKTFEVKDGAIITARVVMYDELEAIDEAQIYLAEEMIKVEPSRRQATVPKHAMISFDDAVDPVKEGKITIASENKATQKSLFDGSGDVLSQIMEHNSNPEDLVIYNHKEEPVYTEENSVLSSSSDSSDELMDHNYSEKDLFEHQAQIMAEPNEPLHLVNTTETVLNSTVPDSKTETGEIDSFIQGQSGDNEKFTLLTTSDEQSEELNALAQEIFDVELSAKSEPNQDHTLEFDFKDSYVDNEELLLFTQSNPISIAGCLGEPVSEDSSILKKGKKKPINTIIPQTTLKNKGGHSISGFEELRNLLIPVKYQQMKLAEKKNDQEKYNGKKINDSDNGVKSKEPDKNELFLNNAIRHLPDNDYSSLFN